MNIFRLGLCFLATALLGGGLFAASANPGEKLKETVDAALDAVYGECCQSLSAEEKQRKVREVIEANYDFNVIIRRAIGRNWNQMNARQQETVLDLIKQLVVKAYIDGLNGRSSRPEVSFGETLMVTDNRAEVPSTVKLDDQTVNIVYRLGRMESGWQLFDIVAEDISVVSNYRQQFDDHFRRSDAEALIGKLQELLKKDQLDEEIQL